MPSSRCWSRPSRARSSAARRCVTRARAMRFVVRGDRVDSLECAAMDASGTAPTARRIVVRARTFVSAAGAIGSPALLLRSGVPDPYAIVGMRTFLHPTRRVGRADAGARRRVRRRAADDLFRSLPRHGAGRRTDGIQARGAADASGAGRDHAARARRPRTRRWMRRLPHMQVLIALLRDGFHRGQRRAGAYASRATARRSSTIR